MCETLLREYWIEFYKNLNVGGCTYFARSQEGGKM